MFPARGALRGAIWREAQERGKARQTHERRFCLCCAGKRGEALPGTTEAAGSGGRGERPAFDVREKARLAAEAGESGMPWKREGSAAEGSRAGSSRRMHRMTGTEAAVRAESKGSFGGLGSPVLRTRRAKVAYGASLMSLSSARARGKAPWRRPLRKALTVCAGVGKTMFACASPRQWNVRSGEGKRRLRQAGRDSLPRAQERKAWKRPKAFSLSRPRPGAGRHNRGCRDDVHRSRSSPCGRGPPAVAMHRLLSRSHVPASWSGGHGRLASGCCHRLP